MGSTGVKSPQTAGLGCVQRAQGVPLLGHPCFWVWVAAILYTDTEMKSRPFFFVLNRIQPKVITSTYSSMISESHPRAFVSVKIQLILAPVLAVRTFVSYTHAPTTLEADPPVCRCRSGGGVGY